MTATAYPLSWPQAFARARSRDKGSFKTTLSAALNNVQKSLQMFANDSGKKLENLVISSNVTLGSSRPADLGVSIWFCWDGLSVCIAVDRYLSVEANLQAIHHIIEARRVELRHGTLALVRASFSGFTALPAPAGGEWWEVLGVAQDATIKECETAYRRLISEKHPDKGGTADEFNAVKKAWEQAKKEIIK